LECPRLDALFFTTSTQIFALLYHDMLTNYFSMTLFMLRNLKTFQNYETLANSIKQSAQQVGKEGTKREDPSPSQKNIFQSVNPQVQVKRIELSESQRSTETIMF
jgi:predicted membrane-bound dolichyl-phosphate-mannose-protein mannosyltransferase